MFNFSKTTFAILLSIMLLSDVLLSQNVAINDNGASPNSNAILDIDISTNDKGLLIPRLTSSQRTAISLTPSDEGLTVYDEDVNTFFVWDGSAWQRLTTGNSHGIYDGDGTTPADVDVTVTDNIDFDASTLFIDGTNDRIGVGTTSPSAKLDVNGTSEFNGTMNLTNDNIIGVNKFYINDPGDQEGIFWSGTAAKIFVSPLNSGNEDGYLRFINDGGIVFEPGAEDTEVMLLSAGGNVGIGTNSPAQKLHVVGTTRISTVASGANGAVIISNSDGDLSKLDFTGNASDVLRGDGTFGASSGAGWLLTGNSISSGDFIGTTNNEDFVIKTNNTEHWRIKANGVISVSNTNQCVTIGGGTTIGYRNVYLGSLAGLYGQSGAEYNTALGYWSLGKNLAGDKNTAVGARALNELYSNSNENTGVGFDCLHELSNGADYNTAIGSNAGYNLGMADYCTMIGAYTDGASNQNNQIAIGYGVTLSNANEAHIGNTSITWIGGQVTWSTYSDKRIKTNINENVPGLDFIMQLRPVTYNLDIHKQNQIMGVNDKADYPEKYDIEKITTSGFIAQEVEIAAENCNYDFNGVNKPKNEHDLYSLSYAAFVVPLVKATQEQQKIIDNQQVKIQELENTIMQMQQQIQDLQQNK